MAEQNKKIRVLMLLLEYHPVFSGHAIYLQQLIKHLQKMNCEVAILAADYYTLPAHDVFDGVDIYRFNLTQTERKWEIKLAFRVIRFLLKHRKLYDILHIHGHLDIYGLLTLFNRLTGKHTVSQMVLLGADDPMAVNEQYRFMGMRYKILSLMDQFLCISKAIAKSYETFGLPMDKLTYIPQGVDVERFHPVKVEMKIQLREKLGLPVQSKLVVFVGAVVKRKGLDHLVDAWSKVQKHHPEAVLVLVGQYEFSEIDVNQKPLELFVEQLRQTIRTNQSTVVFTGRQDQVEEYLQCADIFVLPSRKEGFGNVILEAMACGLPAIVTYMDGVATETVTPGRNGFIVNNVNELADTLTTVLSDKELADKMGENGRQKACDTFALPYIAGQYRQLYEKIMPPDK